MNNLRLKIKKININHTLALSFKTSKDTVVEVDVRGSVIELSEGCDEGSRVFDGRNIYEPEQNSR